MMNWLSGMGQSNRKSESLVDTTVKQIESLSITGKQQVREMANTFREMDSKIMTLKSEKEFLCRALKRYEISNQSYNNKDRKIMLCEEGTQTESDVETSLSMENDILRSRNKDLERSISDLEGRLKQEVAPSGGNILTNVACTALFPEEKYFPVGSDLKEQYEALLVEYEKVCKERENIKRDKDIANNEIRKLGADLVEAKTSHKQIEDRHRKQVEELKRQLEILNEDVIESDKQRESDKNESRTAFYRIQSDNQRLSGIIREHEHTIKEFKDGIAGKINQLDRQEANIIKLKQEIKDNNILLEQKAIQVKANEGQENELNTMIVQLRGNIQVTEKQLNLHLSKLKIIQNERDDLKAENDRFKTELKTFSQLEDRYTIRGNVIEDKKIEIDKMGKELKQKEIQLNILQKELGDVSKKLKNELSLESVNVQNGKTRINELEHTVTQLENKLEEVKSVKDELETRQLLVTQEKSNLERRMAELVNKYENLSTKNAALVQEIASLKQEKEKIAARALKKCISFHCVLKQPQSDQAVGGIVSLLQQQFGNVDLEIIEEAKRGKNVPLLVVLYNLSRLTDDAKGALRDIEASSDVALVVLHSKDVLKPSEQILTLSNVDFRKLGIIVDMGFISAKGIISNDLTSNGVKQLVGFINKF